VNDTRILLTTDVVGGVWDFSITLAAAIQAHGDAHVTLLALGEPSAAQRRAAAQSGAQLRSVPLKLEWMQDSDADVARTRRVIAELVAELRPDVVHANQFAAACLEGDTPVVLTIHSDVLSWRKWTLGEVGPADAWQTYRSMVQQAVRRADSVVAVSAFLAREVRTLYGVDRAVGVIHNGWAVPVRTSPPARTRMTLMAGRIWDAAKNFDVAAAAAHSWEPGELLLAGEQRHPESRALASVPLPLTSMGFLAQFELEALMDRATIYLSPARYDPFGLLPLQAALHGCALLLSDLPSYRELWDGAACFFNSDDPTDLRRQWQHLLEDADLCADFQQKAADRARSCFSPERMVAAYAQLYAQHGERVGA
jgi:glycogen(starch) synthase